ncbi:hypothetical protein ONS96_003203 [Cadophora gregata f. sp. sojae]|nr:hypothetical protein ONS96_003203 [Cadophora gregata f. sp. sojae]
MVFDRGSKCDYDRWEALGNKGWGFDGLLPYFKKNEQSTPPSKSIAAEWNITYDPSAHGQSGNVKASYSPFIFPTTRNIVEATKELNIPIALDQANGGAIGGYWCPHNQDPVTITRSSAEEAYWDTASSRKNLHLMSGTSATRLVTKKAQDVSVTGVEIASNSSSPRRVIGVKKEAVLAAGAIHTPQLLQVSGIGSASHLSSLKIPTVVDLPGVGQNFHDHVFLLVLNSINASTDPNLSDPAVAAQALAQYKTNKTGPYTSPTGDFLHFLPLPMFSNRSAELQSRAAAQSATLSPDTPACVAAGYAREHAVLTQRLTSCASLEIIWNNGVFVLGLESPFSRGRVLASSADIFTAPIADPGFLSNPLDVEILKDGVEFARRLARTEAMKGFSLAEILPGSQDVETYIRSSATTLFHPAGTCKLGKREEGGVVDQDLKVYGVKNLRVVDASMMPILPAAHTMTTVYAVAEKVS